MNTAAAVRQIKVEQEVKATAVASFKEPPPPVKDFAKKALKNFKSVSLTKVLQSLDLVILRFSLQIQVEREQRSGKLLLTPEGPRQQYKE